MQVSLLNHDNIPLPSGIAKRNPMSAQTIVKTELFQRCLDFHGHLFPGLSFGYQATMAGMDWRW